jgi:photosystem II stability/assembly factor-like uncharacterized protein
MPERANVFAVVAGSLGRSDQYGDVGVFRSERIGGKWQHVLKDLESFTVSVHPSDPNIVLAGTADGIWRSRDRGLTFQHAHCPDDGQQIWSFLVDARDPSRIYAGGSPLSIYRSDDYGQSWYRLPDPGIKGHVKAPFAARVMRMVQHPANPDEMYAAVEINGVMRTTDGGYTWHDCSADLIRLSEQPKLNSKIVSDSFAEGMLDAHAITISPAAAETVIVALRMGLFRTTNKGATWEDLDITRFSPTAYGRDIKVSPQHPNTMYAALSVAAASQEGALYRSQDTGKTWHRFDKAKVHGTIMSVALHQSDSRQLYLGARYHGEVFGTQDGGDTWIPMPLPGPVKDLYCLACG